MFSSGSAITIGRKQNRKVTLSEIKPIVWLHFSCVVHETLWFVMSYEWTLWSLLFGKPISSKRILQQEESQQRVFNPICRLSSEVEDILVQDRFLKGDRRIVTGESISRVCDYTCYLQENPLHPHHLLPRPASSPALLRPGGWRSEIRVLNSPAATLEPLPPQQRKTNKNTEGGTIVW